MRVKKREADKTEGKNSKVYYQVGCNITLLGISTVRCFQWLHRRTSKHYPRIIILEKLISHLGHRKKLDP